MKKNKFFAGIGCGEGFGKIAEFLCPGGTTTKETDAVGTQFNTLISGIIGFLTVMAALWFLIRFILAGFTWISAGGDKTRLEDARGRIYNALIGLLIVVGAWVIAGVVGSIVGIDILNPGQILIDLFN